MARRVYLETTVPSASASTRTDPSSIHRRELTRAWWVDQGPRYDVWISEAVVLELAQGDWPGKAIGLELVEPLRRVSITEEVVKRLRVQLSPDMEHPAPGQPHCGWRMNDEPSRRAIRVRRSFDRGGS